MLLYNFEHLPYLSMTGKVIEKSGWSHNGRHMDVNLLVIFHNGECCFRIDGKDYTYEKGDIALVPKNTQYSPHTDTACEYTFFHFDGDFTTCSKPLEELFPPHNLSIENSFYGSQKRENRDLLFDNKISMGSQAQKIELLFRRCIDTQINSAGKMQLLLALQFSEMMFYISQAFCEQFQMDNKMPASVSKIIKYIKENYTRNLSLDELCQNTNYSKQYCMRLFKKYVHMTINDYILSLRMRHAAYLLRSTYMNVNQTADYLGFSNVSYFSRVFKKYYGVSPSAYFE